MSTLAQRIDLRLSQLPSARAEQLEHLFWELLEIVGPESKPGSEMQPAPNGLAALNRIAARGGIQGIQDPMAWQREQRADRPLPGRHP